MCVSGRLGWTGGGRPRQLDDDDLARLGPVKPQADGERLAGLIQVLLTVRSQMLGLGEGLKKALGEMPRAVDKRAVQGLVGALGHIVQHLDSFKIAPGETEIRKETSLSADQITASSFDRDRQPSRFSVERVPDDRGGEAALGGGRIGQLEASIAEGCERQVRQHEVDELCRPLVEAVATDRARAGRELSSLEQALLVGSVRGIWGGPEFGGDWVDRELEFVTPETAKEAYAELERMGYFDGSHLRFAGVRLAVVLMDRHDEG